MPVLTRFSVPALALAAMLVTGCRTAAPLTFVPRQGDEIIVAGQMIHTGTRVVTWMDLNAPYYPSYASAYPEHLAGRSPLADAQLARLEELTGVPLRSLAGHRSNRGPQISFDRPE